MPGRSRLSQRDIDGLLLTGEHYGTPADLLAAALLVEEARLPAITARWRRAEYAATGRLGPGPAWCWLTRDGMTATGLDYPARRPSLGRLAHIRAVVAVRLSLTVSPAWADGGAWWRLRADHPAAGAPGMCPMRRSTGRPSRAARTPVPLRTRRRDLGPRPGVTAIPGPPETSAA